MPKHHDVIVLVEDTEAPLEDRYRPGLVTHVPTTAQRRWCNYTASVLVSDDGECVYVTRSGRWRFVSDRSHAALMRELASPRVHALPVSAVVVPQAAAA